MPYFVHPITYDEYNDEVINVTKGLLFNSKDNAERFMEKEHKKCEIYDNHMMEYDRLNTERNNKFLSEVKPKLIKITDHMVSERIKLQDKIDTKLAMRKVIPTHALERYTNNIHESKDYQRLIYLNKIFNMTNNEIEEHNKNLVEDFNRNNPEIKQPTMTRPVEYGIHEVKFAD